MRSQESPIQTGSIAVRALVAELRRLEEALAACGRALR
jgi:hypothetical protein